MYDGVDYQENGEWKTIYFEEPRDRKYVKSLFTQELFWAGEAPLNGKYMLILRSRCRHDGVDYDARDKKKPFTRRK